MPTIFNLVVSHRCPFHVEEGELSTIGHPNNRVDVLPCPKCKENWVNKVKELEEMNGHFEQQNLNLREIKKGLEITITGLQKKLKNKSIAIGRLKSKGGKNRS